MNKGTVVISCTGHDKGTPYILIYEKEGFLFLCDGKNKTLEKPKKKKLKHVKVTDCVVDLSNYNPLYDAHILKELKSLLKKGGCCLG